jgi:hypothetical protein
MTQTVFMSHVYTFSDVNTQESHRDTRTPFYVTTGNGHVSVPKQLKLKKTRDEDKQCHVETMKSKRSW